MFFASTEKIAFRAFAKPADGPAPAACELKPWRLEAGQDSHGRFRDLYLDLAPNDAYTAVILPAEKGQQQVQIGLEIADGRRWLFTGHIEVKPPTIIGTEVLVRMRMWIERDEPCQASCP